jgi:hypothetical protein
VPSVQRGAVRLTIRQSDDATPDLTKALSSVRREIENPLRAIETGRRQPFF